MSIDAGVLLQVNLLSELSFGCLSRSFFVKVSMSDAGLELFKLVTFGANLLNLTLAFLITDLHLGHLTSQVLFHGSEVDA